MENECRICFDHKQEKLISPCKCSGTMKWVHKSCLDKWIYFKKSNICPVCKKEYIFDQIYKTSSQKIAAFCLKSDIFTTIITIIIGLIIIHSCLYFGIKPNTIALSFFMLILGMHYIQHFFNHKEIDFDFLFDTMYIYSSNNSYGSFNCFGIISICTWVIIDKLKYKILEPLI